MALRLNSLKTRTALALSSVIVGILVFNAISLILTKRAELRKNIRSEAVTFALLTRAPICSGYDLYYASGFYKFRELIRDLLKMNDDVVRIQIINVTGQVVFDSEELDEVGGQRWQGGAPRWVQEPERLEAVKKLDYTLLPGKDAEGEENLEIVAPYLEDWGRHKLSVSYLVSYRRLNPNIDALVWATGGLTLFSMLAAILVAVGLSSRITKPLEKLTAGAKDIAEGHFDRHLDIRSNDELQILAETFNHMTGRLKENVEQLEESNKKLAAVNEELKELDRMKSDLLANVSHELRTPLTAIKGYTDYILERKLGTITEKQEKGLVVVQRNLERLSKSINALLDFSRMDMGRIALNIQPFSLLGLVEQIQTTVRSELEKKHLSFHAELEPDLPAVIADREKLSAVLENLIINAIKFTPEGGRLTVAAARTPDEGVAGARSVEIRVSDTGIGIPSDQLSRIFNRFHQVDGSSTRRFGGVGLGLAIVKSIVEAHGSAIHVDSREGRGTTFRFRLPLLAEKPASPGRPERTEAPAEEGLILVVDDEPEVVRTLKAYLEEEGLAVVAAGTAAEGQALARDRRPDVILLDLLLPDRSGLELLQSLKKDPATRTIPVLVVSVMNDAVRGLTLGAAEYLVKPLDAAVVVRTVHRLLDGSPGRDPLVLVVDDEPDTADLIRDTLRAEGFRTQVAHHGRQAVELIGRKRPDLVILDTKMPERSGFLVLEALAADPSTAGIPVLVLTARGDEQDVKRGLALGARRYMSKPFDVTALIAEVRRHLGSQEPTGERRASL
jgi:signal transduction histidine kinase/DNA-binding response OmpR family regulator